MLTPSLHIRSEAITLNTGNNGTKKCTVFIFSYWCLNPGSHGDLLLKRGVDHSLLRTQQKPSISSTVKIELFNAQSLTKKSACIQDHIMDKGIDFMCLTETWQQPEVYCALNEACPPGYSYLEKSRSTGRGGGLAIIHRK